MGFATGLASLLPGYCLAIGSRGNHVINVPLQEHRPRASGGPGIPRAKWCPCACDDGLRVCTVLAVVCLFSM